MQVSAEFVDGTQRLGRAGKAELLQRLVSALDRVPEDIKGLQFLLGQGYGIDSRGRVRLHSIDNALMWAG